MPLFGCIANDAGLLSTRTQRLKSTRGTSFKSLRYSPVSGFWTQDERKNRPQKMFPVGSISFSTCVA